MSDRAGRADGRSARRRSDGELPRAGPGRRFEGGWIAPDGRLWPTGYADPERHQAVAQRIVGELGIETGERDPADQLERLGWAHLHFSGFVFSHHMYGWDLTQGQLNTLFDVAETYEEMREAILMTLRAQSHSEERGWRWYGWSDLLPAMQRAREKLWWPTATS